MKIPPSKIAVALSGGVDSAVTADLLLSQGHEIFALHMVVVPSAGLDSPGVFAAKEVANRLGIPIRIIDASDSFRRHVLDTCWAEAASGRTPNPCTLCNRWIKFGVLLEHALKGGAEAIATGHYARRVEGECGPNVIRGVDPIKDQSYFLARITQTALQRVIFPLGCMTKGEVMAYAKARGLDDIVTPQSQDVCFVPQGQSFGEVLSEIMSASSRPGRILDTESNVIGQHDGLHLFTRGQRRGIRSSRPQKVYVKSIDEQTSDIVVTQNADDLLDTSFEVDQFDWRSPDRPENGSWTVQTRYRQQPVACTIESMAMNAEKATTNDNAMNLPSVRVCLQSPIRAITPGQLAVFYLDEKVVGSGRIVSVNQS